MSRPSRVQVSGSKRLPYTMDVKNLKTRKSLNVMNAKRYALNDVFKLIQVSFVIQF